MHTGNVEKDWQSKVFINYSFSVSVHQPASPQCSFLQHTTTEATTLLFLFFPTSMLFTTCNLFRSFPIACTRVAEIHQWVNSYRQEQWSFLLSGLITWLWLCFSEDMHLQKPNFKAFSQLPPNKLLKETEEGEFLRLFSQNSYSIYNYCHMNLADILLQQGTNFHLRLEEVSYQ